MRFPDSLKLGSLLFALLFVTVGGSWFTLHKVNQYEEWRYQSEQYGDGIGILSFALASKKYCEQHEDTGDKVRCYESINEVLENTVPVHGLVAQETVALATRGLLWVGAIQAIATIFTLALLVITVYQTRQIVTQSQRATAHAQNALDSANITANASLETVNIAMAENRPYLSLIIKSSIRTHNGPEGNPAMSSANVIKIDADIKNFGSTPAKSVSLNGFLIDNPQKVDFKIELTEEVLNFIWHHEENIPDIVPTQSVEAKTLKYIKFFQKDISMCRYFLRLTYKSEFGTWYCNDYLFDIYSPYDEALGLFNMGRNKVPFGNITDSVDIDGVKSELIPFNIDDPLLSETERAKRNKKCK